MRLRIKFKADRRVNGYRISFDSDLVDAFLFRLNDAERILVERTLTRFVNTDGANRSMTSLKIRGMHTLLGVPVLRADRYLRVWWIDRKPTAHILHLSIAEDDSSEDWFDSI